MTRITATLDEYGLKPIRVNGRYITLAQRIDDISAVSAGRWEGTASGEKFEIIGGRASGALQTNGS